MIIGGGPGGYEAAFVAAQLGAEVTLVERDGAGGACVLTDCVPSKTLIETSVTMARMASAGDLGVRVGTAAGTVDALRLNARVKALARRQSADVASRLAAEGVRMMAGEGRLVEPGLVAVGGRQLTADVVPGSPCGTRSVRR